MKLFEAIFPQPKGDEFLHVSEESIKEKHVMNVESSESVIYPTENNSTILNDEPQLALVNVSLNEDGKEELAMPDYPVIKLTREQLYNEIWEISVAGVAKKYNAPYGSLLKLCKEADIPVPPSGYWTKLSFGKSVEKIPLSDPISEFVVLPNSLESVIKNSAKKEKASKKDNDTRKKKDRNEGENAKKAEQLMASSSESESSNQEQDEQNKEHETEIVETFNQWGQTYNVYKRETLYKEVWEKPVTEVAKKYGVSDVAIHKVCKSLNVPTPPNGYWAKVYAGKPVTKTPLPRSDKPAQKYGIRLDKENTPKSGEKLLEFLEEEEKSIILAIANQIRLPDEGAKMHSKIIAYRKKVAEWHKSKSRSSGGYRGYRHNSDNPPYLTDSVSEETLPRIFRIFDALIRTLEPLGCSLTDDIRFIVMDETVSLQVSEAKDQINHVNTREENLQLLKYEDEKKHSSYAYKPNIRKYDHVYNGRITITVQNAKFFRDCKSYVVEDRLGDILIQIYEMANILRKEREAKEEAERKRKEEERRREERRERYNVEVDRTIALTNLAEDFDIACKIRRYVAAIEANGDLNDKKMAWIEWAKAKADWYDPVVAKEDELLGIRKHKKDTEQKVLKHASYNWW